MNQIVPQPRRAAHLLCPLQFYLALPAPPPVAGLLPARVPSSEQPPAPYIFDNPGLRDLTAVQRERLYEAADMLLEIAIEFMMGAFNEDALRAGEVLFHRAVGGQSLIRPLSPKAFNAEVDTDWLELLARARRSRPITPTDAEAILSQARSQRRDGVA